MHKYLVGKSVGEGQFGSIREGAIKETGAPVVVKIIRVGRLGEGMPHPVVREAVISPRLDHPHVVRTLEVFTEGTSMVLVMERCHATVAELLSHHSLRSPVPENTVKRLMFQLLSAVHYLHDLKVLHRDIKPANCLLTKSNELKLGDFGLSRLWDPSGDMSHEVQSRWYRAPELLLGQRRYGPEVDMWSVGCVMAELLRGYGGAIFSGDGDISQLSLIFSTLGTPDEETAAAMPDWGKIHFGPKVGDGIESVIPYADPLAVDVLNKLLCLNPKKRYSAREAINHPYFMV